MVRTPIETVRLKIEKRDGCFYVSSDDVPGLWLWGEDPEVVFGNIVPAIQTLYRDNRGIEVEVKEAPPASKMLNWLYGRWLVASPKIKDKYQVFPVASRTLHSTHG